MSQQEKMMPKIYWNFPSHLFSAFVYLKRQNCLSRLYKKKKVQDFNWSENCLGETKAANQKGQKGRCPPLCQWRRSVSPTSAASVAYLLKHTEVDASDHLPPSGAQPKKCISSSSPCLKYHLGSFSHKSITVLPRILLIFKLKKGVGSPVKR